MRIEPRTGHFLFLNAGHAYDHLFMLLYPTVVLALERDPLFGDSYGGLLTLSVYGFVAFGAGALPSGWLGDRWSRRGMMTVFFIGIGGASIATGLANGPLALAIGLTAIGLFASIYHPIGIAMVAGNARRLGRELGINGVYGNLGVACAAITAGFLADTFGWRAAFIVPGAVAVATGVAYAAYTRGLAVDVGPARHSPRPDGITVGDIRRAFAVVVVATAFGGVIFNATTIGMPKVFDDRLGSLAATATDVGIWMFVVFVVAAVAQIVVGNLLDRYPLKPVLIWVVGAQVPILALAAAASGPAMLVAAVALMLLVFGNIPISDTIVARYSTDAWRSRIYAVKYMLGLSVGALTVPMLGGVRDAAGGFYWLFVILAACAAVETVAAFALPGRKAAPVSRTPALP